MSDDDSSPLFLYYAFQINHNPLQAPDGYWERFSGIEDEKRRNYTAMTPFMDQAMENLTKALRQRGMWDNTVLVWISDNGGPSGSDCDSANNYPYRGGKYSDMEGGVRVLGVVAGGGLPASQRGQVLRGTIHVADLWATFCHLAGAPPVDLKAEAHSLPPPDSKNVWPLISGENTTSPRHEVPLSLYTYQGRLTGAIIVGRFKLLLGTVAPAILPAKVYPNGTIPGPLNMDCGDVTEPGAGCVFDVVSDPEEQFDLAASQPDLRADLISRALELNQTVYQTPRGFIPDCSSPRLEKVIESGFWAPYAPLPY